MQKSSKEQTLYELLGVSPTATLKEIKVAYRRRAMEYHPDVNPEANTKSCHVMMCKINEAYSILSNAESRKIYDKMLKERGQYPYTNDIVKTEKQGSTVNNKSEKTTRTYSYDEMYNYYNSVDFDEYMQEDFIDWIEEFSTEFIRLVYDYYKKLDINEYDLLKRLYNGFNDIIDIEKNHSKKKRKTKSL